MTQIDGFISPRAARAISAILAQQSKLEVEGSLAEIGTFKGKTFVGLALSALPSERVIGYDLFPDAMAHDLSVAIDKALPPEGRPTVQLVMKDTSTLKTVDWMRLLQAPARFVHIDGDHTYRAVLSDLQLATSHLSDQAVVVIDDYLHDWYPDVTEGVLDGLRVAKDLRPVAVIPRSGSLLRGGTKLICATASGVKSYTELMRATFSELTAHEINIAGHPAITFFNND